jgi:hypothetical protein
MTRLERRIEHLALLTMSFAWILQYHEPTNRVAIKAKAHPESRKGPSQTSVGYFYKQFQDEVKYIAIGRKHTE